MRKKELKTIIGVSLLFYPPSVDTVSILSFPFLCFLTMDFLVKIGQTWSSIQHASLWICVSGWSSHFQSKCIVFLVVYEVPLFWYCQESVFFIIALCLDWYVNTFPLFKMSGWKQEISAELILEFYNWFVFNTVHCY